MAAKAQTQSKSPGKAPKKMPAPPVVVAANLEDDEDLEDAEASASSGGSGPKVEEATTPLTTKNFRNHPDMENFFRFIHDNDLRLEALQIIDEIIAERAVRKAKK
ncbi:MAG TPA: hypothetical protein PLH57_05770 [Oligoflexia bacterium]|nr:hypothetical protein [Oligoflexia bacterium]